MSWQDELRELDRALASGEVSADEYRARRDNILSSAAGGGPQPVPGTPNANDQTQTMRPITGPQPVQPVQAPEGDAADKTQVVNIEGDRTQVVPGQPGMGERTDVSGGWQSARPQPVFGDRTQVVQPQNFHGGPPPQPGWYQQPPPPQQDDVSPPWAGTDFPPLTPTGNPDWIKQGPEVFEGGSSSGGKKVLIIALVVLVLGGLGVGAYFFFGGGSGTAGTDPTPTPTTSQPAPPTTTTPPRPTDPVEAALLDMPVPPATGKSTSEMVPVAQLEKKGLMPKAEVALLTAAGIEKVAVKTAVRQAPEDGPTPDSLAAMVIVTESQDDARALLAELRKKQQAAGMINIPDPLPNMPPTVVFDKKVVAESAVYRGLYVSGPNLVRITTVQKPLKDEAALSGSYRNHTEGMLGAFPAE